MQLLNLSSGRLSLELDQADVPLVERRLSGMGYVRFDRDASHAVINVSGQQLLYIDDWDDPCLISTSAMGDWILRRLSGRMRGNRPSYFLASLREPARLLRTARAAA